MHGEYAYANEYNVFGALPALSLRFVCGVMLRTETDDEVSNSNRCELAKAGLARVACFF